MDSRLSPASLIRESNSRAIRGRHVRRVRASPCGSGILCLFVILGQKVSVIYPTASGTLPRAGIRGPAISAERAVRRTVDSMFMVKAGQKNFSGIFGQLGMFIAGESPGT
ncbi:hypothetical protein RS481_002959 [Salmonella enterica]|nr:hypothetical protein [Salmonella enterica]